MAGTTVDADKLTVPITAVAALVLAGMGWWVNAQESAIETLSVKTEAIQEQVTRQKLAIVQDVADIKQDQALSSLRQQQILQAVEALTQKLEDNPSE